jgi:hypothetical protein
MENTLNALKAFAPAVGVQSADNAACNIPKRIPRTLLLNIREKFITHQACEGERIG